MDRRALETALLALVVGLAARSANAQHEGFGGAAPADAAPPATVEESAPTDAPSGCLMPDGAGGMVDCRAAFSRSPATTPATTDEGPEGTRAGDDGDTLARPASLLPAPEPLEKPWQGALKRAVPEGEPSPIAVLREEVSALEARAAQVAQDVADERAPAPAAAEAKAAAERRAAVLADIEIVGLRLRERCVTHHGLSGVLPRTRLPVGARPPAYALRAHLLVPDPPRCRREELVTDAHIAQVTRLQVVEALLAADDFDYHTLDDKRALERERDALLVVVVGTHKWSGGALNETSILRPQPLPRAGQAEHKRTLSDVYGGAVNGR